MCEHSIGKTIATLRKSKGWTQVELAEKLNVSDKTISKWESEAGFPEISQLPVLATLFKVSIDYLMTGKITEKEVVTISKAELCAKNDDVVLAKEVKDLPKDENGKNIVDYILRYKSFNVFKKLCEIDAKFITRFKMLDAINLAILSNTLSVLKGKEFNVEGNCKFKFEDENEIKALLPVEDKAYFQDYIVKCSCMLPRSFFKMIVTDKRINEETMEVLLSPQNGRECVWYHAFPYLIDEAYKNGKQKLLHRLLDISRQNNTIAYEKIDPVYDRYDHSYNYGLNYFFIASKNSKIGHGLVRILESTIKTALEKGDFDKVDEFNDINTRIDDFLKSKFKDTNFGSTKCYIATADEIRIAKLKLDKSVSKIELQVQAAIHNGIVNIKELKDVANFAAIKKALDDYPIHPFELIYRMYQQQKWRDLFELSVDFDIGRLSDAILHQNKKDIEENILNAWTQDNQPYTYRLKSLCINNNELYLLRSDGRREDNHSQKNIQEVVDYLSAVRQRIIDELANKFDKDRITDELTKDYFYFALSEGNKDLVIIKLCVRMEAVLKCDFGYTGNFAEMIDKYCNEKLTWSEDDGWDYVKKSDENTIKLLHKLRKTRNSLVHSENTGEPMSDDEIKQCIDYICSL